jgi:hypothetical protein
MVSRIASKLARQNGGKLLDMAVAKLLPDDGGKPSIARKLAGAAVLRVATRSVPGAIIVTGGLIAKTLYDRRRAKTPVKRAKAASPKTAPSADKA